MDYDAEIYKSDVAKILLNKTPEDLTELGKCENPVGTEILFLSIMISNICAYRETDRYTAHIFTNSPTRLNDQAIEFVNAYLRGVFETLDTFHINDEELTRAINTLHFDLAQPLEIPDLILDNETLLEIGVKKYNVTDLGSD